MFFIAETTTTYSPTDWLIVAMVTLAVAYIVMRPRMKKRDPLADSGGPKMTLAQQRSVERQMQSLLVELSEMARQISSQLDTRAAKLELLLREADEKLAALKAASSPASGGSGFRRPFTGTDTREDADPPPPLRLYPDGPVTGGPSQPSPPDPRHAQVYSLADQGQTPQQIAQQLDRPSGEIELILALRSR